MLLEHDAILRAYALRLSFEYGEDAYHNVMCEVLTKSMVIRDIIGFYKVAIKRALYKIFRHNKAELKYALMSELERSTVSSADAALKLGRLKHTTCRKGHLWSPETTAYIGPRRTCRICKQARERRGDLRLTVIH